MYLDTAYIPLILVVVLLAGPLQKGLQVPNQLLVAEHSNRSSDVPHFTASFLCVFIYPIEYTTHKLSVRLV